MRLRTHTLAIATLALVFVGQHVFREWTSVTGGNAGRSDIPSPALPGTPDQGWFWLIWPLVAATVLLVAVVVRGRLGREMAAVRSNERAAAVIGVDVARTKAAAFALSGALAAVAGALYGAYKGHVSPEDWGLLVSIQYLAMVLIGGIGTVKGPVLGASSSPPCPAWSRRSSAAARRPKSPRSSSAWPSWRPPWPAAGT